jgi:hypothetical protein
MTPEDEEFLAELYRNLTKQAVPPTSPLYVPLEQLPGQVMGARCGEAAVPHHHDDGPGGGFLPR